MEKRGIKRVRNLDKQIIKNGIHRGRKSTMSEIVRAMLNEQSIEVMFRLKHIHLALASIAHSLHNDEKIQELQRVIGEE